MRTPVPDTIPRIAVRSPPIAAVIWVAASNGVSARKRTSGYEGAPEGREDAWQHRSRAWRFLRTA
jgi:hypothetical protein